MAPLPENNTAVYFLDYTFGDGQAHTAQLRGGTGATEGDLAGVFESILNELEPDRPPSWTITGARYREALSSITLPAVVVPTINAGTGTELDAQDYPRFYTWVGRGSTSGRRVRLFLFGLDIPLPPDYRYTITEATFAAEVRTILVTASAADVVATIAGDRPTWYNYVNAGFNSYWEREQRT